MKKTFFILLIALLSINAYAQKIGINVGTNLTSMTAESNDGKDPDINTFWPRLRLGANLLIPFKNSNLFFNTGLIYSQKGYHKTVENNSGEKIFDGKFKINYLDIPLNIGLKLGRNNNFVLIGGPYLGYGIGKAKMNMDYSDPGNFLDSEDECEFGEAGLQHIDFGLQAGLGYDFNYFQIVIKYNLGLINIWGSDRTSGDKWINRSRVLSISIKKNFEI